MLLRWLLSTSNSMPVSQFSVAVIMADMQHVFDDGWRKVDGVQPQFTDSVPNLRLPLYCWIIAH